MTDTVTLLVPAEEPYRDLGPALARKYLEIAGGSASDGDALADALAAALARVTDRAAAGAQIALDFERDDASVGVQVRCGRESAAVRQTMSVET